MHGGMHGGVLGSVKLVVGPAEVVGVVAPGTQIGSVVGVLWPVAVEVDADERAAMARTESPTLAAAVRLMA